MLSARLGEFPTLMLALAASITAFIGFGLTGAVWAVVIFLPISALSDMAPPLMTAYSANRVGEDMQGLVQGVIAALSSVAAVVAPLLLTGVFEAATDAEGAYLPGAPFLLAGLMVAGIVPLVWRMRGVRPS